MKPCQPPNTQKKILAVSSGCNPGVESYYSSDLLEIFRNTPTVMPGIPLGITLIIGTVF